MEPDKYVSELKRLKEIYRMVKETLLLIEEFDEAKFTYISPINELRNVLDHIMRSLDDNCPDKDYEIKEAEEHLMRAFRDTVVIFHIIIFKKIETEISKFSYDNVAKIFPEYHTSIRPIQIELKKELVKLRAESGKKVDAEFVQKYFDLIYRMLDNYGEVQKMIPSLAQAEFSFTFTGKNS